MARSREQAFSFAQPGRRGSIIGQGLRWDKSRCLPSVVRFCQPSVPCSAIRLSYSFPRQVRILQVRVGTAMKITSKGQVTIPQALRERFGLLPDTEVEFVATANGKELRLVKSSKPSNRGRALVERLRRRGTGKRSTDELLKLMRSEA